MTVVIRSVISVAVFVFLAVTNVLPPSHGFSSSITTRTPAASVTIYASNNYKRKRTSLSYFSNANDGDEACNESNDSNINSKNKERNGLSITNFQRMATSIFAAILSMVVCTSDGMMPSQGGQDFNVLSLARPQVCQALTPDQLLVDDVWREVSRQFFDPTFNGQGEEGWKKQRLMALEKAAYLGPDDDAQLYAVIRGMLKTLNDPYTRFLTPEQYESLTKTYATNPTPNSDSSSTQNPIPKTTSGIGVQLIGDNKVVSGSESSPGMVIVANILAKSSAEKAGIQSGDYIRSVDGVDMIGATAEAVAAKCRGETGTTVSIEIERPPVEGEAVLTTQPPNRKMVVVTRSPLVTAPMIEASTVMVSPTTNQRVGIIKINSFTRETEQAFRRELKQLTFVSQDGGDSQTATETQTIPSSPALEAISAIAIDLRGNLGGYMPGGVDVAKIFLPPRTRIVSEVDKTGRATIYINDGVGSETDTTTPLFILVDEKTASASEILTAALQDNKRAVVVSGGGADKTFGKGRIQNVQALSYGGSGIAVTKARYTTPNGRDIQGVGISPDLRSKTCSTKDSAAVCLESIL